MMKLSVIHWSDLHFAGKVPREGELSPALAVELAVEAINRDYAETEFVLLLSGDVTTGGDASGYADALVALRAARADLSLSEIVVCPGNHDTAKVHPRSFTEFNQFAFQLTRKAIQTWSFENPVCTVVNGDYAFLAVNTAFEGDYSYGSAPLRQLRAALTASRERHQIVVFHHSPISAKYAGGGMKDAYDLLALISEFDVSAVLHGHVHSNQGLRFGSSGSLLFGAGSLGFKPEGNMNNQFAIHEFTDGEATSTRVYRYYRNENTFLGEDR